MTFCLAHIRYELGRAVSWREYTNPVINALGEAKC